MAQVLSADGSSKQDTREIVVIDRSVDEQRMRYRCPEGHTDWDRTNNHLWCRTCARQNRHGRDIDPEHYAIEDAVTGETIPWSRVRLVEPEVHRHTQ